MDEHVENENIKEVRIQVDPGQTPIRIDKFLIDRLEKVSRNRLQNAIGEGRVLVNDSQVKSNYKVRPNDCIVMCIPQHPDAGKDIEPEAIPLDIVYEDDHLLVVNKQAGLVVHPGVGNWTGTLVNGLLHHFKQIDFPIKEGNLKDRPGLVHRIDKDTSGLLVIAKNENAMTNLSKQFFDHSIDREYRALVWGSPKEEKGTIDKHIGRNPKNRLEMVVFEDGDQGKHAITHYDTVLSYYYVTLISCRLETGRTHQIRSHLKYLGHPIFNDPRYGGSQIRKGTVHRKYKQFVLNCFKELPRQALHARLLAFDHPDTGERMEFINEVPEDFQSVLDRWDNYLNTRNID